MVFYIIFNLKFIIKMETINKCLEMIIIASIKEVASTNILLYRVIISDSLDNNERTVKCKKFANLVNEVLKKRTNINIKLDSDFIIDTCKKNQSTIDIYLLKTGLGCIKYKF